jgi:putative nucleotidyltransferase with HDIG domain
VNSQSLARRLVSVLRGAGHSAYFVGGCVRDLLLGREPHDFDVATSARPGEVLRLFPGADEVGAHFGVVLVHEDDAQVEVATFRSDLEYRDGRHPEGVRFETDPAEDARRRDFTINALLLDPVSGEVLDFVDGRADLAAGVIRAIGDPQVRFREDHLRLLRAVRFAARLGFRIEDRTFSAMREQAASIQTVSPERVRDELVRILTEGGVRRGMELLDSSGLLHEVLPEIEAMKGVEQPPQFHPEGDVWIHTLIMLEGLREPSAELALGVLLHDVGKPGTFRIADRIRFDGHVELGVELTRKILIRLRFSNQTMETVEALVANHMRFGDVRRMRESTLKRFLRMPSLEEHMELHRLDCLSSHGNTENYDFVREKRAEIPEEVLRPAPLVTGKDLIAAGFRPGPAFGRVLGEIEDAQLEGRVNSAGGAMDLARELMAQQDLKIN